MIAVYKFFILPTPIWVLLLTISFIIIVSLIIKNSNRKKLEKIQPEKREEEDEEPEPYLSFTKMDYKEWRLEWSYVRKGKGWRWEMHELHPICKKCGCELQEHYYNIFIHCPSCNDDLTYPTFNEKEAGQMYLAI